jgi:hypothetical protein
MSTAYLIVRLRPTAHGVSVAGLGIFSEPAPTGRNEGVYALIDTAGGPTFAAAHAALLTAIQADPQRRWLLPWLAR